MVTMPRDSRAVRVLEAAPDGRDLAGRAGVSHG